MKVFEKTFGIDGLEDVVKAVRSQLEVSHLLTIARVQVTKEYNPSVN